MLAKHVIQWKAREWIKRVLRAPFKHKDTVELKVTACKMIKGNERPNYIIIKEKLLSFFNLFLCI